MIKDIISMAREAGVHVYPEFEKAFEHFAELIRADEREACAKVCDNFEILRTMGVHPDYLVGKEMAATQLAHAIRTRSNK